MKISRNESKRRKDRSKKNKIIEHLSINLDNIETIRLSKIKTRLLVSITKAISKLDENDL